MAPPQRSSSSGNRAAGCGRDHQHGRGGQSRRGAGTQPNIVLPFPCAQCNRSFATRNALSGHMNAHRRPVPYTSEQEESSISTLESSNAELVGRPVSGSGGTSAGGALSERPGRLGTGGWIEESARGEENGVNEEEVEQKPGLGVDRQLDGDPNGVLMQQDAGRMNRQQIEAGGEIQMLTERPIKQEPVSLSFTDPTIWASATVTACSRTGCQCFRGACDGAGGNGGGAGGRDNDDSLVKLELGLPAFRG
ncbi:hypothetical protein Ancab_030910 [Ancistrocladus abbreviatus]